MKRFTLFLLISLLLFSTHVYADEDTRTDLEKHQDAFKKLVASGADWYSEHDKPGPFNVTFDGVDENTGGPVFHITYTSYESYSSYLSWISSFDVTDYQDGMLGIDGAMIVDNGSEVISHEEEENGNYFEVVKHDYYLVVNNPEALPIDHTYTFALTRLSQHGYIMFAFNEIEFEVSYEPDLAGTEAADGTEDVISTNEDFIVEDSSRDLSKKSSMSSIYATLAGLGLAGSVAYLVMKKGRRVKLKKEKPKPKPTATSVPSKPVKKDNPNIFTKIVTGIKRVGTKAVEALNKVSKGLTKGYEKIKSIGINTGFGRLEIGDITGLSGADKIMKINNTIGDLCDVINKNKDISKVWKNLVDNYIDGELGKLKKLVGKGLRINPNALKKLININKEINTIKGLIKDGVKVEEIFDLKQKLASYKAEQTTVEKYNNQLEKTYKKVEKGINIESNNFKKVLRGR